MFAHTSKNTSAAKRKLGYATAKCIMGRKMQTFKYKSYSAQPHNNFINTPTNKNSNYGY
jgi:hypothetical protein